MAALKVQKGIVVFSEGRKLKVLGYVSPFKIQVINIDDGVVSFISPGDIEFEIKSPYVKNRHLIEPSINQRGVLTETSISDYKVAEKRFLVVSELAAFGRIPKEKMDEAIQVLKISRSHVHRLLSMLDVDAGPSSLLVGKAGRLLGTKLLDRQVESIVDEAVEEYYKGPGVRAVKIIQAVNSMCEKIGVRPPSAGTIRQRIKSKGDRFLITRKSGSKEANQKLKVRGGRHEVSAPLELVQIDHCLIDLIVVDSKTRMPIGRPWVTLAIDVYTRVILGMYLSLDYPSSVSVALCIANAILPKDPWLKELKMTECSYPFYGIPRNILVDNAKEFRSSVFKHGCNKHKINLEFRPPATPHYGGHIERLNGTFTGEIHGLPGTTMSNVKARGDYDSEKHSAMTFVEFRDWFITQVEVYHKGKHSRLGCSPNYKWHEYFNSIDGNSSPEIITDRRGLLIDFMPHKRRIIGSKGVEINCTMYYSGGVGRFPIGTPCVVKYDPGSLKKIWVLPQGEESYLEVGYSDVTMPDMTLKELKGYREALGSKSREMNTPEEIKAIKDKNEKLVAKATIETKAVRKKREREDARNQDPAILELRESKLGKEISSSNTDYLRVPSAFNYEE